MGPVCAKSLSLCYTTLNKRLSLRTLGCSHVSCELKPMVANMVVLQGTPTLGTTEAEGRCPYCLERTRTMAPSGLCQLEFRMWLHWLR